MKKWYLPEFDFTIHLVLDPSLKGIKDSYVKRLFLTDLTKDTECDGVCHIDKGKENVYILLLVDKKAGIPALADIVSHEVFHAVGYLYESIEDNTKLRDVAEVPAYYQGWLTGEILEHVI